MDTGRFASEAIAIHSCHVDVIQSLKDTFHQREIVILSKDEYGAWEKARHNASFTGELQNRIKDLNEGKGIVKTMAELEAMANG